MKKCPSCGQELPDAASFCMYCGNAIPESNTKDCPYCGFKDLPQEAVFCPNCGKQLPLQKKEKQQTAQQLSGIVGPLLLHKQKVTYQHNTTKEKAEPTLPKSGYKEDGGLHVGDFFYSDGTTSTELIPAKKAVGIVFSLETTPEEKRHGWTHGHIVALTYAKRNVMGRESVGFLGMSTRPKLYSFEKHPWCCGYSWNKSLPAPHKQHSQYDSVECQNDRDGYLYSNSIPSQSSTRGYPNYPCFDAARQYNEQVKLPSGKVSSWYLPTIRQLMDVLENLSKDSIPYRLINGSKIASSSETNNMDVWAIINGRPQTFYKNYAFKKEELYVLPVAAF